MTWMLYGANGYTGGLIADLAVHRGHRPVLAGRSAERLAPIARRLGLEHRAVGLDDVDALAESLRDVDAVAHCAGPFSATAEPMMRACLRSGTHYLDITGEVEVFEAAFGRDAEARKAGVVLLPGAGFDVVPTDALAVLVAEAVPDATHLDLAFAAGGGISRGTLKSALEGAAQGGRVRVDGQLRTVPIGWRRRDMHFPSGPRAAVSLPWGDVVSAHHSTGIANITTFACLPGAQLLNGTVQRWTRPLLGSDLVQRLGKRLLDRFTSGPGEQARRTSRVELVAEARNAAGESAHATLVGPNTYDLTADAVVRIAERLAAGGASAGTHTPTTAFGTELVRELEDVRVTAPGD